MQDVFCCKMTTRDVQEPSPGEYQPGASSSAAGASRAPVPLWLSGFGLSDRVSPFPDLVPCLFSHPQLSDSNREPRAQRWCRLFLIWGAVQALIGADNEGPGPPGTLLSGLSQECWRGDSSAAAPCTRSVHQPPNMLRKEEIFQQFLHVSIPGFEQKLVSLAAGCRGYGNMSYLGENKGCSVQHDNVPNVWAQ